MEFNYLTRFVKIFREGSQFQNFKGSSVDGRWVLWGEFFPEPRCFLLGLNSQDQTEIFELEQKPKGIESAQHPLILYVRAHLLNQRLAKAEPAEGGGLKLHFLPQNAIWVLKSDAHSNLHSEISVPGRKPFKAQLRLANWSGQKSSDEAIESLNAAGSNVLPGTGVAGDDAARNRAGLSTRSQVEHNSSAQQKKPAELAAEKRKQKLLEKVREDFARAEEMAKELGPLIESLKSNPLSWGNVDKFSISERAFIERAVSEGFLPPFSKAHAASAKDKIFALGRKMTRKKEGAAERLRDVEATSLSKFEKSPQRVEAKKNAADSSAAHVGRKVTLSGGIIAWVGKSAAENAELFRRARSRDLWFHVRGFAGGHVWIHRGQKGFGAKDEPSQSLLLEGAKLAVFNSKLRLGTRKGDVDITERRFLKAIKGGEPGKLEILRSETRVVQLDDEFEKMVNKK